MVKQEHTGQRDLTYSRWHRTIGDSYYMIDIDSIEWRGNRGIVAFIETAFFNLNGKTEMWEAIERKNTEMLILDELSKLTGKPAYLVLHTPDLSTFWIFSITDGHTVFHSATDKEGYAQFIREL